MLRIILGILKLIGILLAVLIMLITGILLLVLLTPVRYRGTAIRTGERTGGQVYVSWLLRFVSVSYSFDLQEKQQELIVRICGVRLSSILAWIKKRKTSRTERKRPSDFKKKDALIEKPVSEQVTAKEKGLQEPASEKQTVRKERAEGSVLEGQNVREERAEGPVLEGQNVREERAKEPLPTEKRTSAEQESREQESRERSSEDGAEQEQKDLDVSWIQKRMQALRELYALLSDKVHGTERLAQKAAKMPKQIQAKLNGISDKLTQLQGMAEEYEVGAVISFVLQQVFHLLKHYLPRKMTGYLHFGLSDPSATGKLTGFLYILLPLEASEFRIEPEFTETVFETEVTLNGKVRPVHVLILGVRLIWNKKLRRLIKKALSMRK